MSYNKRQKLQDNIEAIRLAFALEQSARLATEEEKKVLRQYSGFGGLKFILNPCEKAEDIEHWSKGDRLFFEQTRELYGMLESLSKSPQEYRAWVQSLKNSVLSSFYTPQPVIDAISKALSVANVDVKNFLDPSSGRGSFVSSFLSERPDLSVTAFEKDLITGKVLKALHGEHDIHVAGFETIEERYQGYFDVAASNIPFGDISVFDPAYINGSNEVNRLASKTIHNYFFLKTLDQVRDGGLVAFITSQGVMDSPQNKSIREAMMERAYLLGAIRLPNNLFVDEAGTEVGSDLILLQKDNNKPKDYVKYAPEESAFIDNLLDFDREREPLNALGLDEDETSWLESTNPNAYIFCSQYLWDSDSPYLGKISHGTDPYGKPATVSQWNGSMESLGRAIQERIEGFMQYEFNPKLYRDHAPKVAITPDKVISLPTSSTRIQARSLSRGKKKDVSNLQMSLFDLWDTLPEVQEASERPSMSPRAYQGDIHPYYREGIIVEDRGQLGTLSSLKKDCQFVPLALSDDQESRLRQYVKLRDTYENLYNNEASSQTEDPENRSLLNQHYDEFVEKFGALNTTKNRQVILMDALGRDSMSLERVENGQYVKSDIFAEPTAIQMRSALHVETADEALMASLNRTGGVDLAYISNLCDLTEDELKERLREKIYYNPMVDGYEIAERFLSGNVVEKLDYFEDNYGAEVLDAGEEEVGRSYKALQSVRPRPIPFEELDFNFGERWMPTHYFSEFATELFGTEIHVSYAPNLDEFVIKCDEYWNDKITSEYAVQAENKNYSGLDLLRHALYDTTPFINKVVGYKDNGDTIMGPDHEKMQLAASKIDTIREGFSEWIQGHSVEWKEAMADMYNRKFNCFVRANYDGSHQIFPGLDLKALKEKKGISDIYGSQKDAVWMILQNGGGICDHEVGTGKTLIMCLAAHEMKRLGLCHKPIIIGMKANVNEIATTYQSAYPNDRILYAPTESKDFKDRETFFNRMKNNDWDCIIMSHDQFNRIPQSVETMRNVLYEEMQALEEALEVYVKQGSGSVSKKQLKGLEQRKENLAVELANLNYKLRTRADDVVDFKTMGIDHIFVDESQQYKNLPFTTRNNRVAGLGDPKGSQRARNLQYAIRTIQDRTGKDLGATFLSGTTISNSLTELYLLFKYLRPRALDVQDIHSFDAWAAIFARKSRDYEINVAGQIVMKERYRHFIKVPELAAFYNEITDYKTAADVGLERPKMEVSLENIQPTEDHQDFSKRLLEFAQSGDGKLVFRPELEGNELQAKMLLVTGMGKKASLSPKLVNPDYHEGDDTKIGFAAKNIADYYRKYDAQKGTQFVFCDLSTPKKGEWSAYQELKNRLVNDYGIPEEEVQFIQDHGTERKRKAVIDKMNKGEVRVLMGSTTTLGTGVNAQERAVAVHHLDLPWRPSDMEQRNGRAVRKGNLVARDFADNKVDVLVYAVERSLDSYNFYLLQAKSDFIRQMKTGSLGKREFDQGGEDEESGMPFAEYVAITSGNTDLLERAKLEKRILGLESERKAFYKQQQVVQRKLDDARGQLTHHENILGKLEQDRNVLKEVLSFKVDSDMDAFERLRDESGVLSYTSDGRNVQLQHITFDLTQDEPLGDYLQKAAHQEFDGEAVVLYFMEQGLDWPLVMTSQTEYNPKTGVNRWTGNHFGVRGKSGILYTYNNGKVSLANKQKAASYPFMALARIPDLIAAHEAKKNEYLRQIPELERIASKEWEKAEELKTLKTQMQELDKKINMEMDIKTLQQQGQVSVPEELPYEIEHHNYGRQPWELKFAVKDFPYLNRNDLNDIGDKYHGSIRSYYGNVHGDFKHQFGAEEAFKELSRLNAEHRKDLDWLKNAASDIYESSSVYAVKRLNEMGLDRQGNPLTGENSHKMKVLSLGDYSIPEIRDLAHGVKDRHDVATHVAAAALSRVITEMADANKVVLVPMPSHNGYGGGVEKLCREMSVLYDIPYEDVLYSSPYESLYSWKKQHPNEPLPDLLFGARKDRINNKIPVFIDNVIDTGHTARAALDALGGNPVMVVVGSTGKHQTEGDELEVEVVENGLQYIHENTPDGLGFTGVSRKEIDNLLKLAQKFDDTSSAWAADHELRKLGIDKYTGYPLYMVEHICDRWIYTYDDLDAPVKELLSKGSAENVFTQEELAKISPEDMKMFREVYEEVQNPNLLSYDYRRRLMVLYDVIREKLLNEYEIDWKTGKRARFEYVDNTSANEGTSHVAEDDNTIRYMKGENYFSVREEGDLYVVDLGTKIDVLFDDMPEWFGKTAHELNGMFEKVTGVDGAVNNRGTFLDRETAERFAVAANEHYDHKLRELEEVASSRHNVQSKLRDALIDRMRKAGISVVTDVQEGQRALDEANGIGVKAMGSRTESKKALIARSTSLLNLDAEKQLIIDVFTGKRNHQVLTIERSDGSLFSFEISEGNEIKGGTRHALYRHFGTGEGVILITDILAIPDVLRSGDRKQDGNKFLYSLKRDNKELTVVTEKRGKKEVFVTLYSDVTLNEKASLSKSKNTNLIARSNDNEALSDTKVQQNIESTIEDDEKIREQRNFSSETDENVLNFGEKHGFLMTNIANVGHYARAMREGDMLSASNAFRAIKEEMGMWYKADYPESTLADFIKEFEPVKEDLFKEFGNLDELRAERESERVSGYTMEEIEEKVGSRLTNNNYTHILAINPFVNLLRSDKISEYVDYRSVIPTPSMNDYYVATRAEFKNVGAVPTIANERRMHDTWVQALLAAEAENMATWEEMKESGQYEFQKSPKSDSEYLLDRQTGDIYRFSNHWGVVASCEWGIDQFLANEAGNGMYQIAKCNISDFKPVLFSNMLVGNPAYDNAYIDALDKTISNYEKLLASRVEMTDFVRQRVESVLEDYKTLQKRYDEEHYRTKNGVRFHKVDTYPIFVSNAQLAVERIQQQKATPLQWLNMITKNGGIKAGEDKWMGLSVWLKENTSKTLTKGEVLDFISQNAIEVEEVNYVNPFDYQIEKEDIISSPEYQGLVEDLIEYDNDENPYVNQEKFNKLRHEDNNFFNGFSIDYWGEGIDVDDPQSAAMYLGLLDGKFKEINDTRLSYTTEGLENRKEVALVVPSVEPYNESDEVHFGDAGEGRAVAWVRFGETTDADGNKVLVIDEIQSKRHQDGRENGYVQIQKVKDVKELDNKLGWGFSLTYKEAEKIETLMQAPFVPSEYHIHPERTWLDITEDRYQYHASFGNKTYDVGKIIVSNEDEAREYLFKIINRDVQEHNRKFEEYSQRGVPDAPFDKNWHELAMKRILRYAADNEYDRIAWTTGEQQAERYDLSKSFNYVSYNKDSQKLLAANVVDGVIDYNLPSIEERVHQEKLADYVGKENALKLIEKRTLQGEELRIGGEGMESFYDKILVNFINKYGKQWDVQVEELHLLKQRLTMHSIPVNEAMKESVSLGQPMFFKTTDGKAYGFVKDDVVYIDPRIATAETPIHEYTHLWAEALRQHNPEEWKNIVNLMKGATDIWNKVKKEYSELTDDDTLANEVLAQYSGKRGYQRLMEETKGQKDLGVLDKLAEALGRFWNAVADFLHIHFTSKEEVADRVLHDLLTGVNPLEYAENIVDQRETEAFKGWFGDWKNDTKNSSKVVDSEGKPLVVEHATNADFTEFDISHIGENSKDNGLFGAGFYFGTHAPGWMQESRNTMRVYLDIKHPFEVTDDIVDIYSEICGKMDTPAMRGLTITGFNDHQSQVGTLIDQIKNIDDLIKNHPEQVQEMMVQDEELEYIHPNNRQRVWREHEIVKRSGIGSIALSWQSFISNQIGSYQFSAAAIQDGYDGVIVDRGDDYKEYVVFEANQIKSATYNVGTFNINNNDIRFHFIGEEGARQLDQNLGGNYNSFLEKAKYCENMGYAPHYIKFVTGWEKGVDDKWRYELGGIRDFNPYGNQDWLSHHPEVVRYRELHQRDVAQVMDIKGFQPLSEEEKSEMKALAKDSNVRYFDGTATQKNPASLTVKDYMDAPMLFAAYPELRDLPVKVDSLSSNGKYVSEVDAITGETSRYIVISDALVQSLRGMNANARQQMQDTFIHEIQHYIQEKEGFARGGNLSTVATMRRDEAQAILDVHRPVYEEYQYLDDCLNSAEDIETAMRYFNAKDEFEKEHAHELKAYQVALETREVAEMDMVRGYLSERNFTDYQRLAGEVEARNAVRRSGMSFKERWKSSISSTEDVPREEQILNFRSSMAASMERSSSRKLTVADREAGGALVEQLRKMGIVVHTDLEENRKKLREFLLDKSDAGKVRYMETERGQVYGYSYKGEMYLDMRKVDAELPLARYAHLWVASLRRVNPDNWKHVVSMFKADADTWKSLQEAFPEYPNEDDLVEAAIVKYSGKQGAEKLQRQLQNMSTRDADYRSRWGNIFQNITHAIQNFWKHVGDSFNIRYSSKEELADQILKDFSNSVNPVKKVEKWLQERDKAYADAVIRNDMDTARALFWEALSEHVGNGITPFMAVDGYRGKLDRLARDIKDVTNTEAINQAADLMAPYVRAGMVLVPAPGHEGYATHTLALANAISERSYVPVADVLVGVERARQYDVKRATGKPILAEKLGIRKIGELPKWEGVERLPVVIDNVVHSGNTAEACVKALGKGVVLSLASAVSQERHVASLKSLAPVVYDKKDQLIPLSKRFELKSKWLGRVVSNLSSTDLQIQGLGSYSLDDIKKLVKSHVDGVLKDSFSEKNITVKEITVIGSRTRDEAHEGSDLDILVEYEGNGVREDAMFNALNEEPLVIDGIKVDINPINPHYSLNTTQWLERDAAWRAEDTYKSNQLNNSETMKAKVRPKDVESVESDLLEARGNLMDIISEALDEMNGHVEIAQTELTSVPVKGDWKNEGNGHVFMEVIKGEHNVQDAMFHDVHDEKYTLDEVVSKLDYSEVYDLTIAVREAQIANFVGQGDEISFVDGLPVSQDEQSVEKDYIDLVKFDEDGKLNIIGHRLDVNGNNKIFEHGDMMYLDGIDELYATIKEMRQMEKEESQEQQEIIGEMQYKILTGEAPTLDVQGEYHVNFEDHINAVSFKELQDMAKEHGGSMRVTNGQEWGDFYSRSDSEKFAEAVVALNEQRMEDAKKAAEARANLSPIVKQFYDLKDKHPDALLLFRQGDFYVSYQEDAKPSNRVVREETNDGYKDFNEELLAMIERKNHPLAKGNVPEEYKAYVDSFRKGTDDIPSTKDVLHPTNEQIDLLPKSVQKLYARYEALYEDAYEMRSSRLVAPCDKEEAINQASEAWKTFKESLCKALDIKEHTAALDVESEDVGNDKKMQVVEKITPGIAPEAVKVEAEKIKVAEKQESFAEAKENLSPIVKQYYDLKSKHPDALLLFRQGDFYEAYQDDAKKCSNILGITLTTSIKQKGLDGKALKMAGFPYHALDTYLPKLIRAGKRIAICDPNEVKKLNVTNEEKKIAPVSDLDEHARKELSSKVWNKLNELLPTNGDRLILDKPFSITQAEGYKGKESIEVKEVRRSISPDYEQDVFVCGTESGGINTFRMTTKDLNHLNTLIDEQQYSIDVQQNHKIKGMDNEERFANTEDEFDIMSAAIKEYLDKVNADYYRVDFDMPDIAKTLPFPYILTKEDIRNDLIDLCKMMLTQAEEKHPGILERYGVTVVSESEKMADEAIQYGKGVLYNKQNNIEGAMAKQVVELNDLLLNYNRIANERDNNFRFGHVISSYSIEQQNDNSFALIQESEQDRSYTTSFITPQELMKKVETLKQDMLNKYPELLTSENEVNQSSNEDTIIKNSINLKSDSIMDEREQELQEQSQQQEKKQEQPSVSVSESTSTEQKKPGRFEKLDYSKYQLPEGATLVSASVETDTQVKSGFRLDAVLDIKGEQKNLSAPVYKNNVEDLEEGKVDAKGLAPLLLRQQVAEILGIELPKRGTKKEEVPAQEVIQSEGEVQKKKPFENIDYSKYVMPEGANVEKANVWQMPRKEGEDRGKYAISALINGERKTATLYPNDLAAYFSKDENKKASLSQLVAKYFGKSTAVAMGIAPSEPKKKSLTEAEKTQEATKNQAAAQQEKAEKEAKEQEVQKAKDEQEKKEQEKKEDTKEVVSEAIQVGLLVGALAAAKDKSGVWLNEKGKGGPAFYPTTVKLSPFNTMMMALHSDAHGYKTNLYTNFAAAQKENISVQRGEKGLPYNWYAFDKYVNKYNAKDVIDKAAYNALPEEEKGLYKVNVEKDLRSIFNIDQTTMKVAKREEYNSLIPAQEKPKTPMQEYSTMKEKNPEMALLVEKEDHYVAYNDDAKKIAEVLELVPVRELGDKMELSLSIPKENLEDSLRKLVSADVSVGVVNKQNDTTLSQNLAQSGTIRNAGELLVQAMKEAFGDKIVMSPNQTQYDPKDDVLNVQVPSRSSVGDEKIDALESVNQLYRSAVAFTGGSERINRLSRDTMLPEDAAKHEALVQELSAGVMMARQGLPATISKTNIPNIPYWERELKENPKLITSLERDVNNAVQVLDKIQRGENVNYSAIRGEKSMESLQPKFYSISRMLADIPNEETKEVVLVRDQKNSSAAVILPAGASLDAGNEIPGMNKNRFVVALKKEGFENIKFYNAGGALGLVQPNEYFADKKIEVAKLKNYDLIPQAGIETDKLIARTSEAKIERLIAVKGYDNNMVFSVKAEGGDTYNIVPNKSDLNAFFASFKNGTSQEVRQELGKKYLALATEHPDLQVNLVPKAGSLDMSRIDRVSIFKDNLKADRYLMLATIDGQKQKPVEISGDDYQRMWLVDDKKGFKLALASNIFSQKLGIEADAQFRGTGEEQAAGHSASEAQETSKETTQVEQESQKRSGGHHR